MGIYDRDYYRREGPSFLGSIAEQGKVCKWIIIVNVIFFVLQLATMQREQPRRIVRDEDGPAQSSISFTDVMLLDADKVVHQGQVWRLLTSAFLHSTGNLFHIIFNMMVLWMFGKYVEDHYGPKEFLFIYALAGIAGSLAFVAGWGMGLNGAKALGASGAVSGVLLLCAAHYPSMTVRMFFLFPMPIWTFVIVNIALDSFVFISQKDTGVAVACHLGGAAFAWVYYKRQWHLSGFGRRFQVWWKRMSGPKLRVYREEPRQPVPVGGPPLYEKDEQLEAKLDAVLAKVARTGQSSLTDAERQVLLQASERYKRKRT